CPPVPRTQRPSRYVRRVDVPSDCRCGPWGTNRGSVSNGSGTRRSRRRLLKTRVETCPGRPAFNGHIDISRIAVEPTQTPPGPLGCRERRSEAKKEIKHKITVPRYALDRIGNHPLRLDRRMQGKTLPPAPPHGVHRRIVPDIRAVAAMPAEFNHVEM